MTPTKLPGFNLNLAENQPEYLPLPVVYNPHDNGSMTSCWKLTLKERLKVLFTGRFYFDQWTFNQPLQPQRPFLNYKEPHCPRCGNPAGQHLKPTFMCPTIASHATEN